MFVVADKGIQTGPDSKYFALYTELKKAVNNEGKELVLQVGRMRGGADSHCGACMAALLHLVSALGWRGKGSLSASCVHSMAN